MCALLPNGALRAGASTPENIRGNPRCTTARPRVSNHAVERFQQRVDSTAQRRKPAPRPAQATLRSAPSAPQAPPNPPRSITSPLTRRTLATP